MSGAEVDEEQILLQVPPEDLVEEQSVLGGMMLSRDAIHDVIEVLTGSDFYRPAHTTIYDTICSMAVRGERCDPITVAAELGRLGELTRVGGAAYLHKLVNVVPTAAMAESYAQLVRERSLLRAVAEAGTRAVIAARSGKGGAQEIAEAAVEDMRAARDRGLAARDEAPLTLEEFLAQADDEPDWVIPGVLARWDRLMITAGEGGGKSLMIRQILVRAAAGLHPWRKAKIKPVKALLVDVENSATQARPWLRKMTAAAAESGGAPELTRNLIVDIVKQGLDLTSPADRSWLARRVEAEQPDIIGIGPIYKLAGGNPNEEESAKALMSALEMLRVASNGAVLLIEAHSPHQAPGTKTRNLRPIGSSVWLRWPEFGFGLSLADELGAREQRLMDWVPWRGARSEREWPERFLAGAIWPWRAVQYAGNEPMETITITPDRAAEIGLAPPEPIFWEGEQID